MKKVAIILFLLFATCKIALNQTVTGIITDKSTGRPIADASIRCQDQLQAISGPDGKFTINLNEAGQIKVVVTHLGYRPKEMTVIVSSELRTYLNIALEPAPTEIDEIVITATRTVSGRSQTPAMVKVLNSKQLQEFPVNNIDDLLRQDASLRVDRANGIFSKNSSITMRGLNSSARTLVMLDGMPLNKADGGGVNYNRINMESLDRAEVIKGPASALYGENAMGGVINLVSKELEDTLNGSIRLSLGSCNTQGMQAYVGNKAGFAPKLSWSANTFYRRGDGYIIAPPEIRDSSDVKTYLSEFNSGLRLQYKFSKSAKLESGYNYFDDKRGDGTRFYDPDGGYNKYRTHHAWMTYRFESAYFKLNATAYYQYENFQNQKESVKTEKEPPFAVTQYQLYLVDSHRKDAGLMLTVSTERFANQRISYGTDIRLSGVNASDIYFTSTDTMTNQANLNAYALFAQDEISLLNKKLMVVAGIRVDAVYFGNASFTIASPSVANSFMASFNKNYEDQRWFAVSPKFGARYFLNPSVSFYVNYARGFRPAMLDDMCRNGNITKGFKMANPDLKPEHLDNYEIGGKIKIGKYVSLEPAVYYSEGTDFQYFVATGDSIFAGTKSKPILKRENVSRAKIKGFETSLIVKPLSQLEFTASYAYNHSVISDFDTVKFPTKNLSGKFLTEVPKQRFTASANWRNRFFACSMVYDYTSSIFNDDENLVIIPSYYSLSAKISHELSEHASVSLSCQNITGNIYLDNKGNQGLGRFFMIEARYKL